MLADDDPKKKHESNVNIASYNLFSLKYWNPIIMIKLPSKYIQHNIKYLLIFSFPHFSRQPNIGFVLYPTQSGSIQQG